MSSTSYVSAHKLFLNILLDLIIINFPDLLELPFLYLDGNRTYLPSTTEDSVSDPVLVEGGFPFGNSNQTTVHV